VRDSDPDLTARDRLVGADEAALERDVVDLAGGGHVARGVEALVTVTALRVRDVGPEGADIREAADDGVFGAVSLAALLSADLRSGRPLADAEDHELGRVRRREANLADHSAVVDVVLRHRRAVAANEERIRAIPSASSSA
jgi:hypothetical protein